MIDETETIRREMVADNQRRPWTRPDLEAKHGQVWDTANCKNDFEVIGFAAPFVVVKRRSDGSKGQSHVPEQPPLLLQLQPGVEQNDGGLVHWQRMDQPFRHRKRPTTQ